MLASYASLIASFPLECRPVLLGAAVPRRGGCRYPSCTVPAQRTDGGPAPEVLEPRDRSQTRETEFASSMERTWRMGESKHRRFPLDGRSAGKRRRASNHSL